MNLYTPKDEGSTSDIIIVIPLTLNLLTFEKLEASIA